MAGLDTLTITNSGLFSINQKIANSRTYSSSLITVVGSPAISDGIASGLSTENYFTYSPLNFIDPEKITVLFKGTYIPNGQSQCAWSIQSTTGNSLHLIFENNEVTLKYGNFTAFSFGNIAFSESTEISIYLIIRNTSYEFTMNYGKKVIQKTGNLDFTIPLSTLTSLTLGNASPLHANPWLGSINLNEFSIYNNGELLYTPSNGATWNFSNILISDGKIPLQDNSRTTAGHIYSFPVTEIVQSGSTVLLTCQISEDSYLTIKEIGLYIQTPNGKLLFGSITNLNVNKEKNLAYNLVFTVNTTINVVNAIGFPADNGIIVEDPDFIEFKDFTTLEEVNTYILTNLERIIRMNAGAKGSYENSSIINNQAGIGHNRPQVIYRIQQDLEEKADCYNTIDTFLKLVNRFQEEIERQVDYDTFNIVGDLEVPLNGETEGFAPSKYITCSTPFLKTDSWKLTSSFTTKDRTEGTVTALTNLNPNPPLEIGIQNDNCYLNIHGMESIHPIDLDSYYLRDTYSDTAGPLQQWSTPEQVGNITWNNIAYGDGKFIAVSNNGIIAIYTESMWSDPVQVTNMSLLGITYSNGKFIAVGDGGKAITSTDGMNWSTPTEISDFTLRDIIYKNNIFIAVGDNNGIVTSEDGETWSTHTLIQNAFNWRGVTYGNGKFVVVGDDGYTSTSVDGALWSSPVVIDNFDNILFSVAYGNQRFIAVGARHQIFSSTDGITWSTIEVPSNAPTLKKIIYNNGVFTAVGDNGKMATSSDGETWEFFNVGSSHWRSVASKDNELVAVGYNGHVAYFPVAATYYGWEQKDTNPRYNFHCNNLALSTSPIVEFPRQDITVLKHDTAPSSEFSITLRVMFNNTNGTQYVLGRPSIENSSFEIFLENKRLCANLYENSTKKIINESLRSRYDLKANRYYNVTLSYYEGRYSLHYEMEPIGNEYPDEETVFIYSDETVSLDGGDTILVGQRYLTSTSEWTDPVETAVNTLHNGTYGNGKYIVVGSDGYIMTSIDGHTWNTPIQVGAQAWYSTAYGNGKYVVVGENGYCSTSENGIIWTTPSQIGTSTFTSIIYNDESQLFVAIQSDGYIYTSSNGASWTQSGAISGSPKNSAWTNVAYGNGKYVAVGHGATLGGYFSVSTDTITWTAAESFTDEYIRGLAFGEGKFVTIGYGGYALTSSDGVSWSSQQIDDTNRWTTIAYGAGMFLAVGKFGYSTSTDGITWEAPSSIDLYSEGISYGNNKFVVIGLDGRIASYDINEPTKTFTGSIDFSNFNLSFNNEIVWNGALELNKIFTLNRIPNSTARWTEAVQDAELSHTSGSFIGMAFGNDHFVAIDNNGCASTSTNGINWTQLTQDPNLRDVANINGWKALSFGNGKFILFGYHYLYRFYYVSTSTDGVTWNPPVQIDLTLQQSATNYEITYGNNKFVLLQGRGELADSTDGVNWTYRGSIPNIDGSNIWQDITYGNNKFVALGSRGYISTSVDGKSWSEPIQNMTLAEAFPWSELIYANNKFIAIRYTGAIAYSEDGVTWEPITQFLKNDEYWGKLSYGKGKVVALGATGYISTSIGDTLYDEDFIEIVGAAAEDYTSASIINENNLFPIANNTKYTLTVTYSENESTQKGIYTAKVITDDQQDTERVVLSQEVNIESNLSNRMNLPVTTYVGNSYGLSKPFSAIVDLIGWEIKQGEDLWIFDHDVALNDTQLIQCYRMPDLNKNQYSTKDLCNLNRKIRFLSNKFEGNDDVINFSYKEGLTLCIKVALQDAESKVLLYKSNLVNDIYFSLTFVNQELKFTMITKNGFASVSRQLTLEEYASYTNEPIMLTVILTPQYDDYYYLQMYKNNEAVTEEAYVQVDSSVDPAMFILSNYIEELPTYEVTTNGVQETETAEVNRFVKDLVVIKGAISPNELAYINSLFDTNY